MISAESINVISTYVSPKDLFGHYVSPLFGAQLALVLYDLIEEIALLSYESVANSGCLMLCCPEDLAPLNVEFNSPFSLRDTRGARKMLQVSDEQLWIVCDGINLHGFTRGSGNSMNAFVVQFRDRGVWDLVQGDSTVLMRVGSVSNAFVVPSVSKSTFFRDVGQVFGSASVQELWEIVSTASGQSRGTNLLICENAALEAERLDAQCTRVFPVRLSPFLVERVTSIDGSVILDPQGICHALGAILDGAATRRGDRARGGRYNSAIMYVESSSAPCLIVVISQDGTVDLVRRAE
jgi:hypothetical protein